LSKAVADHVQDIMRSLAWDWRWTPPFCCC